MFFSFNANLKQAGDTRSCLPATGVQGQMNAFLACFELVGRAKKAGRPANYLQLMRPS